MVRRGLVAFYEEGAVWVLGVRVGCGGLVDGGEGDGGPVGL